MTSFNLDAGVPTDLPEDVSLAEWLADEDDPANGRHFVDGGYDVSGT